MSLRVTHLSRHRDSWDLDLGFDGWFIRFSSGGDQEAWDDMRDELKTWGRTYARWIPAYHWRDGKQGAWWIDSELFRDHYSDQFEDLDEAKEAILNEDVQQWIAPRRRAARQTHTRTQIAKIPPHLFYDYLFLGVGANATVQDVKDAYRSLAKVHHPDAGGTHDGFIKLQQSYERIVQWVELAEKIAG